MKVHVVEDLLRKANNETLSYWKDICCRCTLELPLRVPTTYATEKKETIFKFCIMPIVFVSFKHLKPPISIIIPVTIPQIVYLDDSYCISPNLI